MSKLLNMKNKIYLRIMLLIYGISLITCVIVDYVLNKSLTWSIIVLVLLMMAFSITNLLWILNKYQFLITGIVITFLIYLLLYVCCNLVQGNWLFSFAYPIATYALFFSWLVLIVLKYFKINYGYKAAIIMLLASVCNLIANPFAYYLMGETYSIKDSFIYDGAAVNHSANGIVFLGLIIGAVVSVVVGIILSSKAKKLENCRLS